ncbi:MAG: DNA-directed RNA polymerase subunit alpha C-terminal domain-containing protein [Parabacteroides sp.]|nr:DNA-directed RNA polymerase subunit alpha C-terminal domain-containing protein [Parabacteroides sp.]
MQKSRRYEVHTKWGWFSLDEGSYQDYLAGKLWITWPPDKNATKANSEVAPKNVSQQALDLREQANRHGVFSILSESSSTQNYAIPYTERMSNWGIEELNLSVRSSNGLMRAGMNTFGKLVTGMSQEGGLFKIRNLGIKSEKEIRTAFIEECYSRMDAYEKAEYWQCYLDGKSCEATVDRRCD